jgi:CBS domain-containing protein
MSVAQCRIQEDNPVIGSEEEASGMGLISELLGRRSPVVHIVSPDQTVLDAVALMAARRVGAVPIVENGRLVGIFSERDLLRRVVAMGRPIDKTRLAEVMTADPVTASPNDERALAVLKMEEIQCRHLPIVAHGAVVDMLSIRDLLFVELEERAEAVESLRRYIGGSY